MSPFHKLRVGLLTATLALLAAQPVDARAPVARMIAPSPTFITSIDTMKQSRDTETHPLSDAQIADDIAAAARLGSGYITVDTRWDYPFYMARGVAAIRATGRRVWFRLHPNGWGADNGTTSVMTPARYEAEEHAFIVAHPSLFRPGDILDLCPEPENGLYWRATYGDGWTYDAPNDATRAYNAFIRDTSAIADAALHGVGIDGVITTVRSTNSYIATHPRVLEAATVARMGRITVDSYPEGMTTDPAAATAARVTQLDAIARLWRVPVVVGEMGYSNRRPVDDATQHAVLAAEFHALTSRTYLAGVNYWVGAGGDESGGYTHILTGSSSAWTARPAAFDVAAFYAARTLRLTRVDHGTRDGAASWKAFLTTP